MAPKDRASAAAAVASLDFSISSLLWLKVRQVSARIIQSTDHANPNHHSQPIDNKQVF
jgi:hypothetical protein